MIELCYDLSNIPDPDNKLGPRRSRDVRTRSKEPHFIQESIRVESQEENIGKKEHPEFCYWRRIKRCSSTLNRFKSSNLTFVAHLKCTVKVTMATTYYI